MGGSDQAPDPLFLGQFQHLDTFLFRFRTVIQTRKYVTMYIDDLHSSALSRKKRILPAFPSVFWSFMVLSYFLSFPNLSCRKLF